MHALQFALNARLSAAICETAFRDSSTRSIVLAVVTTSHAVQEVQFKAQRERFVANHPLIRVDEGNYYEA